MADEIKDKAAAMDQKYQELITNQQTLMAADTPSRPGS